LETTSGAYRRGGKPAVVAPNHLERQFKPERPNQSWVTDITYIRTHEGWLYLAVVLDLFSRQVIGWSMGSRIDTELVLNALGMALWRRQPKRRRCGVFRPRQPVHRTRLAVLLARPQSGQQHEPAGQLP